LKDCDRILEAQKIIILAKMGVDWIFSVIEDIEEIRYILVTAPQLQTGYSTTVTDWLQPHSFRLVTVLQIQTGYSATATDWLQHHSYRLVTVLQLQTGYSATVTDWLQCHSYRLVTVLQLQTGYSTTVTDWLQCHRYRLGTLPTCFLVQGKLHAVFTTYFYLNSFNRANLMNWLNKQCYLILFNHHK